MSNRGNAFQFLVLMGFVAMLADLGYEGMRSVSGPYLGLLGAGPALIGFVGGLGELVGFGLRVVTGWVADRTRSWWPLLFVGYGVNLIAIPGLAFTGRWEAAVALVLLERLGKALRSPAKSTLVSHAARALGPGKAFGLEEALDQLGAVSGPLLVALAVWLREGEPAERLRAALLVLGIPIVLNLLLLVVARLRFPDPSALEPPERPEDAPLPGVFLLYLLASGLFAAGLADWALLSWHLGHTGALGEVLLPMAYSGAMAIDAVAALLFGALFDRSGLRALALALLLAAPATGLVLLGDGPWLVGLGVIAWAIGMGAQESIAKAAIATMVPRERRTRAYGWFFGAFGLCWWLGSWGMGALYGRSLWAVAIVSAAAQLLAIPLLLGLARRISAAQRAKAPPPPPAP